MKNFFENIRNSDETTKKVWHFVLSIGSAALIIAIWFSYVDYSIEGVGAAKEKKAQAAAGTPFLEVLKNGWNLVSEKLTKEVAKTNDVAVQSANFNFIMEGIEKVSGEFPE
ncbi:MAG: hypothetical protein PHP03_02785 [Candidatus Pacebacteria bacterium]|nr:hypothetical protein [Candidatus Paceibacterota bacterium]